MSFQFECDWVYDTNYFIVRVANEIYKIRASDGVVLDTYSSPLQIEQMVIPYGEEQAFLKTAGG